MRLIADHCERLDHFLARSFPSYSRSRLAALVKDGGVLVNGKERKASFALAGGEEVQLELPTDKAPHDLTPADIAVDVVYEDNLMLIVNKPRGLATHPAASLKAPSLVNALLARNHQLSSTAGAFRPGIVHRLDKDTSGLMVVAKTDAAHVRLARQIESKTAERRYFAVVRGRPDQEKFVIDAPIARDERNRQKMAVLPRGRRAVTHVRVIASLEAGTLLAVRLETGRTHQIRVHLSAIGHPVLGDKTYGVDSMPMQLHAAYLALDHPASGERVIAFAGPPEDFVGRELCTREAIERA